MVLIETPTFKSCIEKIATEEEFRQLQNEILKNPNAGKVIRGGGGVRKIRFAVGSQGKSGGARAIYYYKASADQIYFLLAYEKSGSDDLSDAELKILSNLVKEI
ncbi:type II toxin-antitoxin system RelE/ParE family toxin [Massilia sp. SM-13]|uniref:type II toxin-antitoxin system RelE/ParE family toxin n=1 Tax=Pseudoduganella rhizocola TaxID=3382643 RepID=UPI0038B46535